MYGYGGQVLACRRGLGQFAPMTDVQITGLFPPRFQPGREPFTAPLPSGGAVVARQAGWPVVECGGLTGRSWWPGGRRGRGGEVPWRQSAWVSKGKRGGD